MPVAVGRRGPGHGLAAHPYQAHRVLGCQRARDRPGGQLAHAVPGRGADAHGGRRVGERPVWAEPSAWPVSSSVAAATAAATSSG